MFLIVWRGLGILVPIVMIASIIVTNYLVNLIMKDPDYSKWTYWPKALGAVIAAISVWFLGRFLHRHNKEPGNEKDVHTMFGIRFEYWAFLPLAFSVIGYFV